MPRIGIMSDSHDNLAAVDRALEEFKRRGVVHIIHAGDIISPFTLRRVLAAGVNFVGVFGNNDGEILGLSQIARERGVQLRHQPLEVEVEGLRFFLIHGAGGIEEIKRLASRIAEGGVYDVVVYGHTHEAEVRWVGRTLLINPGEVCGYLSGRRTLVTLETESRRAELVEV